MNDPHPLLDWLGGPIGVGIGLAVIALIQAVTAVLLARIHGTNQGISRQLDGGLQTAVERAVRNANQPVVPDTGTGSTSSGLTELPKR